MEVKVKHGLGDFNIVLTNFEPVSIGPGIPQEITLEYTAFCCAKAHCIKNNLTDDSSFSNILAEIRQYIDRYAPTPKQISKRYFSIVPDPKCFISHDGKWDIKKLYDLYNTYYPGSHSMDGLNLRSRHEVYSTKLDEYLQLIYSDSSRPPDDLIHVTCSGYLAPNPLERMVANKGWPNTLVTNSYHMSCYGAFPAIRMAYGFLSTSYLMRNNQDRQVDIIHTELLTLHHKTNDLTESDIYVMTLFSDGVIKYSARLENEYLDKSQPYLRVLAMHKQIIPNSSNEIEWSPGPFQFEMNLSAMVPRIIKRNVKTFVVELLMNAGINFDTEKDKLIFAIHPGGVKLVEHLQQALEIDDIQVAISKEIFFENGNMSSSTIPYILHRILFNENVENGKYIVSLAYGPGLTLAGAVMQKVCIT